ncbi:MAG: CapA family protein [Elusimicrobia bacterium]|nr:CapA family protein [Elusimicrobiota bacterium]
MVPLGRACGIGSSAGAGRTDFLTAGAGAALCAALWLTCAAQAQQASTAAAVTVSSETVVAILTAVWDIRLDGPVGQIIARDGMAAPTAAVRESLRGDIVMGNLECPVTSGGIRVMGKTWTFRAPARNLEALKAAGFNLLNIANNHVMDYGPKGFRDTLAALGKEGLPFIGGGKDRSEAERLHIVTVRGLRVGLMGFTSTFPESAWAGPRRPGVAYSDYDRAGGLIREARSRCDVLVVVFHGGTEKADEPNDVQKAFAHLVIDSGADLFIGHHPHVIQPMELYQGKPIIYSLGNFLFVSPTPSTRLTVAARVRLTAQGVDGIDFLPLDTNWGRPIPANAAQREELLRALDRYGALGAQPQRFQVVGR